jgi:glycosyltransferase involved in cell wall biosynthesis
VVDDRRAGREPLPMAGAVADLDLVVLKGSGVGPAAARNLGWRASSASWVVFLDDDVIPQPGWKDRLVGDLSGPPGVGASSGRVQVPLPEGRRPTDWERNVAGLEVATWATADMAYRRRVLESLHGFDERFPRAYREDADLALRAVERGWYVVRGTRQVWHPVRPAPWYVSVAKQAGNADDALMARLHGRDWRRRASARRGGSAGTSSRPSLRQ